MIKKLTTTAETTEVMRWRAVDEWNIYLTALNIEENPARSNAEASRITTEDARFLRAIGIDEDR
jgi:hypothetical protein